MHLYFAGGEWIEFVDNGTNGHQKRAIDAYFAMGGGENVVITVPHACGGMFVATFKESPVSSMFKTFAKNLGKETSIIGWYIPEGGRPPVQFCYTLPGILEMWEKRLAEKWCTDWGVLVGKR